LCNTVLNNVDVVNDLGVLVDPHSTFEAHHSVNSSSHSVNGDIAIQWKWSNFDHS